MNKSKLVVISLLVIITFVVWFLVLIGKNENQSAAIYFLDVGQGDSSLIRTPDGQTMLIDGGPNNKILEKLGKYISPLKKRIDVIVLTHPHADHITGLIEVLKRYEVGLVVLNGVYLDTDNFSEFLTALKNNGAKVVTAEAGEAIHFGPLVEFDILFSGGMNAVFNKNSESSGAAGNDLNDTSIVGKLIFKNFSTMFAGDATIKVENQLRAYGEELKSDILKIGHHGSKYSSSLGFLKNVAPAAAIIELGIKNFYGFPSEAALSRLQMVGANVFRTDLGGDIKVLSDGSITNIYKEKTSR